MFWVIDRFEGGKAVCQADDKSVRDVPRDELPPGCREGEVVRQTKAGYEAAPDETQRRREAIRALEKDLWA